MSLTRLAYVILKFFLITKKSLHESMRPICEILNNKKIEYGLFIL